MINQWALRALIPLGLCMAALATGNYFIGFYAFAAMVLYGLDLWVWYQDQEPAVWAVTDDSTPTNVVTVVAHSDLEAIGMVARDTFGMHAERTDIKPDDLTHRRI